MSVFWACERGHDFACYDRTGERCRRCGAFRPWSREVLEASAARVAELEALKEKNG